MKKIFCFICILLGLCWIAACQPGHGLSPAVGENAGTGLSGRIEFIGQWPDSTKEVRVAVLDTYPRGITDADSLLGFVINNLVAFSDTIPRYTQSYDYFLPLEEGFYEWVVVVWFPDIELHLFGVRELGAYYGSRQDGIPSPVYISKGSIISGVDIQADFSNLENEAPFF